MRDSRPSGYLRAYESTKTKLPPPMPGTAFPQAIAWPERAIMAVPKRKSSNARSGSRRAHHHKKPKQYHYCPQCSTAVVTHVICPNCGHYGGRTVVEMSEAS
jgi:large subunit ribosomal protein L32